MKIDKVLIFILPLLFVAVNCGYQETVAEIQHTLSNAYAKCFKFVITLRKKSLEAPPYYEWSRSLLKTLTENPNEANYKEYLNTTFARHQKSSAFITALTGLPTVNSLVWKSTFNSLTMISCYLFIKYFPFVFGSVSRFFTWVQHFKLSTMIPVYMSYFLIASTLQFANTSSDARHHLTISKTWFRDFHTHHSSWVNNKTVQMRCLMNEYFDGMGVFRNMSQPIHVYVKLVREADNVILSKYKFMDFHRQYFTSGGIPEDQIIFHIAYVLMDTLHHQLSEKTVSQQAMRLMEYRMLFKGFTDRVLQLPTNSLFSNYTTIIWFFTIITLLIVIVVCYSPFMENYVLKEKVLKIASQAQNAMMAAIVVKTAMFIYLLARVAHVQTVQQALLDANMTLLDGLNTTHGIELRPLFLEAQRVNKTMTETLYHEHYVIDADPDMFLFNVNESDFKGLETVFPIDSAWTDPDFENVTSVTQILNIRNIQIALLKQLHYTTEEDSSYFTNIIFGYNYNRFATSMLKHIIVPVSTPVWSLILMPVYHFVISLWVMFALPYTMKIQIEQDI